METDVRVRRARPDEADLLSALALRSKSHWGYDDAFLEAVRDELAVSADQCSHGNVFAAERNGRVLGFYELDGSAPHGELASLFVDLEAIGTGVGRTLLDHALRTATSRGFTALALDADPGAESFYLRNGAIRVGESPSGSIPGRMLPHLRFDLS